MTNKFIMVLAVLLVAVCLLSGGCSKVDESKINSWKDLLKIPVSTDKSAQNNNQANITPANESQNAAEMITVKLYFIDSKQHKLVAEDRRIGKVQGIARETMQELIKGPSSANYQAVFPAGTKLLDINVKPEGLCIVDLSGEANKVSGKEQGSLMIQAIADTLGQFPSVKEVSFLINGEKVNTLGGLVDIAQPVQANHTP
jgi:spore germination protein GerM